MMRGVRARGGWGGVCARDDEGGSPRATKTIQTGDDASEERYNTEITCADSCTSTKRPLIIMR